MHHYTKPQAPIKYIYFCIAFLSIVISMIVGLKLKHISVDNFQGYLRLIIAGSPLAIYGVLFFLFDQFLWKLPLINILVKVPNIEGVYKGKLRTSYDNFKEIKEFSITIKQRFNKMVIIFETPTSKSMSLNALLQKYERGTLLIYNYQNEPKAVEQAMLNEHKGTAWLEFNLRCSNFDGKYYTDKRPLSSKEATCNYGMIEGAKIS